MSELARETILFSIPEGSLLNDLQEDLKNFGYNMVFQQEDGTVASLQLNVKVGVIEVSSHRDLSEYKHQINELKNKYEGICVIAAIQGQTELSAHDFLKAGCEAVYKVPFENELLVNRIFEIAPIEVSDEDLNLRALVKVNILEFEASDLLPFNLYVVLPSNKKILLYRKKNNPVEEKVIEKFKSRSDYNIYIKKSDILLYQKHCSKVMTELMKDEQYSEIDRTRKIQKEMNNLMRGFFVDKPTEEETSQILHNVQQILDGIPDPNGDLAEVVKHVDRFANEYLTNQSHARNVAVYCSLFGLMLGNNNPQALRVGGTLHDIGLVDLPDDLVAKEREDMDEEEWSQYQLHPGAGKFTLDQRKIKLPDGVMEMVSQHHEETEGTGYPYGLKSDKIHPYAKICAFADEFDKLTSVRMGYVRLSPKEAVLRISGLDGKPASARYDVSFHYPLVKNLLAEFGETIESQDTDMKMPSYYAELNASKVNVPGDAEIQAFLKASIDGDIDTVEAYMAKKANINVVDEFHRTALSYSIVGGHNEITHKLLSGGADVLAVDREGNCPFLHAVKMANLDVLTEIFAKCEDLEKALARSNKNGDGPIKLAVASQNPKVLSFLLKVYSENDKLTDISELKTYCASVGSNECLQEIEKLESPELEAVADAIETPDLAGVEIDGATSSSTKEADSGSRAGLDVNFRNKRGQTYAHIAANLGNTDILKKFINMRGEVSGKDFSGRPPLFYAVMKGHVSTVTFLIENEVRLNLKDDKSYTALHYAIQAKQPEIVQKLIAAGERIDPRVNGMTPLMIAAFMGQEEIVKSLLEAGADPSAKDYKAKIAADYAASKGHQAIADLLKPAA